MSDLIQAAKRAREEKVAYLLEERRRCKGMMEAKQAAGLWEEADRYHEANIAPLNEELERLGVW